MKISIVTITYNAARSVQRTLDSVATQTWPSIEHLIIDGASTDDTLLLVRRYQATSPHEVIVRSEPDRGLYDAMNKGLRQTTGDYVVFLNAGDALASADTLSTVASLAVDQRPAVIYGDTNITDSDGHVLRPRRLRPPQQLTWRSFRQGMLVCHQAFYVRRDIAQHTGYDLRYRHSADVDWCIRVMKEAQRQAMPLVNAHCVLALFEEGGDTTQHHRDSLWERFDVMRRHYGLLTTVGMHLWFVLRAVIKR